MDGVQVAYSNLEPVAQFLGVTLTADTLYTLKGDVGDRKDTIFPGYTIGLHSGGQPLAVDNSSLTPNDGFLTSTLTFLALPGHPNLGQVLEIRLASAGLQTSFDNVRLGATPTSELIPALGSRGILVLGLGLLALGLHASAAARVRPAR